MKKLFMLAIVMMMMFGCIELDPVVLERMKNRNQPRYTPQQKLRVATPCPRCGTNIPLRNGCSVCSGTGMIYN